MIRRINLKAQQTPEELEQLYRKTHDGVKRSHLQIIWLLAQGKTTKEVIAATGYVRSWISKIAKRYNQGGVAALGDRRQQNSGGQFLLNEQLQGELKSVLANAAPDGGLWSGPKIARWMSEKLGEPVAPQRGWDYLQLLGYSPQVPRPRHVKADLEQQAVFKKNTTGGRGDPENEAS